MNTKKLRLITEIFLVAIICFISFIGVYKQNANRMENIVKQYSFSKDLSGYRELVFMVSDAYQVLDSEGNVVGNTDDYSDSTIETNSYTKTETKVNNEEDITKENYEKSKKIIEDRLKKLGVKDYNLSQDLDTGTIYLQIPEDDDTDHTVSNILQSAEFKIKDSKDDTKVFITNDDLKNVAAVYNTDTTGTTVYLQMEFTKKGKETLKQISSNEYATKEDVETEETDDEKNENEEETENEEESEDSENTQKEITLSIDNNSMITTSFDEPIENGIINLSMGASSSDSDKINESLRSASTIAILLNSGAMPITYTNQINRYVKTDVQTETIRNIIYVGIAVMAIAIIFLILKYKLRGLIAGVAYIGFLGLYLLLIRYTNVLVSIESGVATVLVLILNYILTLSLLKVENKEQETVAKKYKEVFKNMCLKLLPIIFISAVFTFTSWTTIAIFGMFMFWGVVLMVIYNFLLTRDMLN